MKKYKNCGQYIAIMDELIKDYQRRLNELRLKKNKTKEDIYWENYIRESLRSDQSWRRYLITAHKEYCVISC